MMDDTIKRLKSELLALKHGRRYANAKPITALSRQLSRGEHTIIYEDGDFPPLTFLYYLKTEFGERGIINLTSVVNNRQSFYLRSDDTVQIISTRPIISIS